MGGVKCPGGRCWSWLVVSRCGLLKQLSCTCTSAAKMKRNWMKWSSGNYKNARLKACNNYYFKISLPRHDFRCVFMKRNARSLFLLIRHTVTHNCNAKMAFCTLRWAKTLISIHGQSKRGAGFAGGLIAFMVIKTRQEFKDIWFLIVYCTVNCKLHAKTVSSSLLLIIQPDKTVRLF